MQTQVDRTGKPVRGSDRNRFCGTRAASPYVWETVRKLSAKFGFRITFKVKAGVKETAPG